jgi:hypothetical protein
MTDCGSENADEHTSEHVYTVCNMPRMYSFDCSSRKPMSITENCPTSDVSPRTTSARGGDSAAAKRSDALQLARSQLGADTNEQLHSRRPFIPTDLVQNTAEYLGRVAGLLSFRGVSTEWQCAVSDAVGFLNGRCWNRLECNGHDYFMPVGVDGLWTRLRLDDPRVVARCAVLCLRPRLETVTCRWSSSAWIPLRLFGETNEALVTLSLQGIGAPDDLSCLLGCVALRELSLQQTQVTNESFAGLGPLLARLHKLDGGATKASPDWARS